jgi:hypothetical protein
VFRREHLYGIIVYGAHTNTTTLDPGEVAMLSRFGPRAALGFDHIAYDAMQQRFDAAFRLPS